MQPGDFLQRIDQKSEVFSKAEGLLLAAIWINSNLIGDISLLYTDQDTKTYALRIEDLEKKITVFHEETQSLIRKNE